VIPLIGDEVVDDRDRITGRLLAAVGKSVVAIHIRGCRLLFRLPIAMGRV
jgi:hypothetical protein